MTKFSVIVQDLNAEEARLLINELDGGTLFKDAQPQRPSSIPVLDAPAFATAGAPPLPTFATARAVPADVDSTGLPWDDRIHAGSKSKNNDGSFKKKKGIQPVEFERIAAELKAGQPSAPAAPQAPSAPVMQAPPMPQAMPSAAPPPPPAAPVAPSRDFQGLMQQISKLFANKAIVPTYPDTIVSRVNSGFGATIATITDVANDPRMVEYAWQCLEVDGKAA